MTPAAGEEDATISHDDVGPWPIIFSGQDVRVVPLGICDWFATTTDTATITALFKAIWRLWE